MDDNPLKRLMTAQEGETLWLPMLTGSMAPAILPGEAVEILIKREGTLRWGETAVFYREGQFTCHRVYLSRKIRGKRVIFERGDANERGSWVERSRVFGVVVRVKSEEGEFRPMVRKPLMIVSPLIRRLTRRMKRLIK